MTSQGRLWKQAILKKSAAVTEPPPEQETKRAQRLINSIPKRIKQAIRDGSDWIRVSENAICENDIARGDLLGLTNDAEHSRPLTTDDLKGFLQTVVAWCSENDLECFLARQEGAPNCFDYYLRARPIA